MNWKTYAIVMQVVCLALIGTFIELFSTASDPSLRGILMWLAAGAGFAIPALLLGCLGLLYKHNRLAGFAAITWLSVTLLLLGSTR